MNAPAQTNEEPAQDVVLPLLNELPAGWEYHLKPVLVSGKIHYEIDVREIPFYKEWAYELLGGGSLLGILGVLMLLMRFWNTIRNK